MAKKIPLTRGMYATVDDEDYDELAQYKWRVHYGGNQKPYARRYKEFKNGRAVSIMMHRQIMDPPPNMDVDHIDGDGLNNRRSNLRVCTRAQNMANSGPRNGSRYKGTRRTVSGSWSAELEYDGQKYVVGMFDDEESAARAYDYMASQIAGEYAYLNFPDDEPFMPPSRSGSGSSSFRGVSWDKVNKNWRSIITVDGERHFLGCFHSEIEAAFAYDDAALRFRGERARLNFPARLGLHPHDSRIRRVGENDD